MTQNVWKLKDAEWINKFETVVDGVGETHKIAVEWVRENLGFEDEVAIHAAAFSIKKEAMQIMANQNMRLVFVAEPGDDNFTEDAIANLEAYAEYRSEDVYSAFAFVVAHELSQRGNLPDEQCTPENIKEALRWLHVTEARWSAVGDKMTLIPIIEMTLKSIDPESDVSDEEYLERTKAYWNSWGVD